MKNSFPALDVDLLVEHDGHRALVKGSGHDFVTRFPTLPSLMHFSRILWPWRKHLPSDLGLRIEWSIFRFRAKRPR